MMQHLKLNRLLPYPFLLLLVVLGLACGGTPEKEYSGYNGRTVIPEISVQFLSPEGAYISEVEVQISDDIPERSQDWRGCVGRVSPIKYCQSRRWCVLPNGEIRRY